MGKSVICTLILIGSCLLYQISAKVSVDPSCEQYNVRQQDLLAQTRYTVDFARWNMQNVGQFATTNTWDYYKIWTLFDTYFDINHDQLSDRWGTVIENLEKILNTIRDDSPTEIYVLCNDGTPVITKSDDGNKVFHDPLSKQDSDLGSSFKGCMDFAEGTCPSAYTSTLNTNGGVKYIVLCLQRFPQLANVESLQQNEYLGDKQTFWTSFLHELCHIAIKDMRGTRDLPGLPGERYGLVGTAEVRKTYADQNPDSLVFFAHAIRLSKGGNGYPNLLWDDGMSMTRLARYNQLVKNNDPRVTDFKLDRPTEPT